jgi:arylsulfatase A-like enzyme
MDNIKPKVVEERTSTYYMLNGFFLLIALFSATFIFDLLWVHHKGYQGLVDWVLFAYFSLTLYMFFAVGAFLIAPVVGRILCKPKRRRARIFDFFTPWWVYIILLIVLLVNEELISGRFSFANAKAIIGTLLAFIIPSMLLTYLGKKQSEKPDPPKSKPVKTLCYFLSAFLLLFVFAPLAIHLTSPTLIDISSDKPSVLLITLDTLRADHLNTYGYGPDTGDAISAFAEESIVFENAFTPIPLTNPAHATIFTGNLPQNHLVLTNTSAYEGSPTLKSDGTAYENLSFATILHEQGYKTFAAVSAIHLGNEFGWGNCFDSLNQYMPDIGESYEIDFQIAPVRFATKISNSGIQYVRKSDEVNETFRKWLPPVLAKPRPFLAWLHYFDVHVPYSPSSEDLIDMYLDNDYSGFLKCRGPDVKRYNEEKGKLKAEGLDLDEYISYARACYDAELLEMDMNFGRLIDDLKRKGLYDNTLIIVCADHGEGIGERNFIGHNSELVDYETRVPLFIKPPGYKGRGKRVHSPVTLCDIAPTVYDILDIEANVRMDGTSLVPLIDGEDVRTGWPVPGMIFLNSHSLRWENKQVIRAINPETQAVEWSFYDLSTDPGAFNDLYATEGLLPENLKSALLNWIDGTGADFSILAGKAREKKALDAWTIEQLRANGYLN